MPTIKKLADIGTTSDAERVTSRVRARRMANMTVAKTTIDVNQLPTDYDEAGDKLLDPLVKVDRVTTPFDDLPFGLYLCLGGPNVGKSITTLGLCIWQNAVASTGQLEAYARYCAISEPRAPRGGDAPNNIILKEIHNLPAVLPTLFSQIKSPSGDAPKIAIGDSIGFAMRSYPGSGLTARGKTGTMTGGMDAADQEFCRELQSSAMVRGVFIGVVGATEVPFAESLEGLVEGMMEIASPGTFTIKYRGASKGGDQARTARGAINIPDWALNAAARHLGYASIDAAVRNENLSTNGSLLTQHYR